MVSICLKPTTKAEKYLKRDGVDVFIEYLLSHLMHEFRHFVQDRIFNRDVSEITYENSDVRDGSDAYYNNPLEKDANRFESRSLPKALELYKCLKKAKLRNIDTFNP